MATISCHYANAALYGLKQQGFDTHKLLIKAGINPKLTSTPSARVSDHQLTRLIQLVWNTLDDEFMGFTGSACKYGVFALMAKSVRRCGNLREVLRMGIEFYNLFSDDIRTELTEVDDQAHLSAKFKTPEKDPDHFYQEFWLVIWHRFASWIIGKKIPLLYANLAYPQPAHAAELKYLFPCPQHFNQGKNELTFDSQYLNLAPVRSERDLAKFLENSPADLMTIPGDDPSLKHEIVRLITETNEHELNFPKLNQIADQLNMTPQTLHRRLTKEGTSYQRIKDNIRRDIAVTRLVKDRMPVKQVAEIVGFSEARSFTRAFKHWTGLSPREYCRFV